MAHRGASDLAPENSMAAFHMAVEHGADLLETDLWIAADGELMCHHDETLERMAGDPRRIVDVSSSALARLRLRDRFGSFPDERIPTLAVLSDTTPLRIPLMLEVKDPRLAEPRHARRLAQITRARIEARTVGIIGFDLGVLLAIRASAPGLVLGHIPRFNPFPTQPTELLGPIAPLLRVNPAYVRMAHRRGQRVCPLDPRLHDNLARYLRMDVDAVLTNDPRATRERIRALRAD